MRAIQRKLFRDLWHIKGQAFAIAMVIAAGVAMYIMYLSAFDSLRGTQTAYYERYRFADVFASLKRAPLRLQQRIAEIPGVAQVDTRVVVDVSLDVEGLSEPATGRLISIPAPYRATLNDVFFRLGRSIEPGRDDEVLVSEAFALAHDLGPGDTVAAVINGRRQELEIVGVVLSPEYVYSIRPGELIPDDSRFGIFWMERKALATAFDMEGGFNDVALTLTPEASTPEVIARLDRLIEPYGGLGAIPRSLQFSHWYLDSELTQLQNFGVAVPMIFLSVAAFLLNVVLTRIVAVQREQIAELKALGYSSLQVGVHYVQWGLAIAIAGVVIGTVGWQLAGVWSGLVVQRLLPVPDSAVSTGPIHHLRGRGRQCHGRRARGVWRGQAGDAAAAGRSHAARIAQELSRDVARAYRPQATAIAVRTHGGAKRPSPAVSDHDLDHRDRVWRRHHGRRHLLHRRDGRVGGRAV